MTTIAAIQMASTNDVKANLDMASQLIEKAAEQGAKLAVLPENFATLGLTSHMSLQLAETFRRGPIQQHMSNVAKKNKIYIVGGTIPLITDDKKKYYSSSLVWDPQGDIIGRYDKIHLFDVMIEGKEEYRESDYVLPGEKIIIVDTPIGKIGLAICYDLRFPELFRAFMLKGAQIIVLPSAFTVPTGMAHWEILLRARAIENLCYVVAPGEIGLRADGRPTYGNSMIIGPWGEILTRATLPNEAIMAEVDLTKIKQMRQQFPALNHYQSFVMQNLSIEENT